MVGSNLKTWFKKSGAVLGLWGALILPAMATLPFETATTSFHSSLMTWLTAAASVMIVVTCLMLAFGEWGDGFKKFLNILFWLSLAFGVTTVITLVQ